MADEKDEGGWVLYPPLDGADGGSTDYGTRFFNPNGGGDPVWFQHVFWMLGHWEVYPIILLALAFIVALVWRSWRTGRAKRYLRLLAMWVCVALTSMLAFLSYSVVSSAYQTGMAIDPPRPLGLPTDKILMFAGHPAVIAAVMMIFILTAIPVRQIRTSVREARGLHAFLFPDLVSGLYLAGSAIYLITHLTFAFVLSQVGVDMLLHDTYYVVAHIEISMTVMPLWLVFWLGYRYFERVFGVRYMRATGVLQFVGFYLGLTLIFLPQIFLTSHGMPHRYVDYEDQFTLWSRISSFGYIIFLFSLLLAVAVIVEALVRKHRLKKNN